MENVHYLEQFTSRKEKTSLDDVPDSLNEWMKRYMQLAVIGVRSEEVTRKIGLHLKRFLEFFIKSYGHDRISTCLKRDVLAWQRSLQSQGLAPATINNHMASLSAFTTWVQTQDPNQFPAGDPAQGIRELGLPPLEPRALSDEQVRSLKNVCDRLERFHQLKGRRWKGRKAPLKTYRGGGSIQRIWCHLPNKWKMT